MIKNHHSFHFLDDSIFVFKKCLAKKVRGRNIARLYSLLLEIEEIASSNGDLLDLLENETHYTESVTARYIGRAIGAMLKDSTSLLNRVEQLLVRNIQDIDNSPMGKVMSFDTLEESIHIIEQIYLGIQDKTS